MKKNTKEKKDVHESLAYFLSDNSNKSFEEAKNISDRFLKQIQVKLEGTNIDIKSIFNVLESVNHNQPIYLKQLPFISLCEHHLLPFFGYVDIGIFPSKKIAGISKFSDLVEHLSNQLTLQEKLTEKIGNTINDVLECEGVFVRIKAKHLCSDMMNPKNSISDIITTYSKGLYELDYSLRSEAILNLN